MNLWTYINTEQVAGNSVLQVAGFFLLILVALVAGRMGRSLAVSSAARLAKRERHLLATAMRAMGRTCALVCFSIALKLGFAFLSGPPGVTALMDTVAAVVVVIAIARVLYSLVDVVDSRLRTLASSADAGMSDMLVSVVGKSTRVTIVILAGLQLATILSDKPLTSVIAGLGVGGLAVALAAQDTIKNFFGSLILLGDRPFQVGERVVVDGHDGPVESVGLRSTRVRTLDGHLVTIPNGELANRTIQNIGKRPYIRRLMNVTITYDTPPQKVQRAVDILKDILNDHEGMRADFPPRVFFNDFNSASLNILAIYWYHPPDYWAYLAFTEKVNMELLRRFNDEGIDFAFPTQTLYLAGDDKRPLNVGVVPAGEHHQE